MTETPVLRMAWVDARDLTVHLVEVDLSAFPDALRELLQESAPNNVALFNGVGLATLCGVPLPRIAELERSLRVDCADCLARAAGPEVTAALELWNGVLA